MRGRGGADLMYSFLLLSVTDMSAPPGFSSSSSTCAKGQSSKVKGHHPLLTRTWPRTVVLALNVRQSGSGSCDRMYPTLLYSSSSCRSSCDVLGGSCDNQNMVMRHVSIEHVVMWLTGVWSCDNVTCRGGWVMQHDGWVM